MITDENKPIRYLNAAFLVGLSLSFTGLLAVVLTLKMHLVSADNRGAQIFPLIASAAIFILGIFEAVRGINANKAVTDKVSSVLPRRPGPVLSLFGLSVIYLWGIYYFGYILATAVAAPLAFWLFGMRKPLDLLTAAFIAPLIYHLVFFKLLGVYPPYGQWFDLLDVLGTG